MAQGRYSLVVSLGDQGLLTLQPLPGTQEALCSALDAVTTSVLHAGWYRVEHNTKRSVPGAQGPTQPGRVSWIVPSHLHIFQTEVACGHTLRAEGAVWKCHRNWQAGDHAAPSFPWAGHRLCQGTQHWVRGRFPGILARPHRCEGPVCQPGIRGPAQP